jgi:hypothetical protein
MHGFKYQTGLYKLQLACAYANEFVILTEGFGMFGTVPVAADWRMVASGKKDWLMDVWELNTEVLGSLCLMASVALG